MTWNHEQFEALLNESIGAVNKAAKSLFSDCDVYVPTTSVAPNPECRYKYVDDGDIKLTSRWEVKRRQLDFTDRWSYPYSTVFVDERYKIDKRADNNFWSLSLWQRQCHLLGYVIMNKSMTHACIVPVWTSNSWIRDEKPDPKRQRICQFYAVEPSYCDFITL